MRQLTVLPDFHFLLTAPNLGAEWLFDAARAYWDRFRPIIVSDTRLIRLVPSERLIAVTVLARRDIVGQLGVDIAQASPLAYFDPVVSETLDEMRAILDERAAINQPFGVALATPFPTVDVNVPNFTPAAIPTANLPPTQRPPGFITATPSSPVQPTDDSTDEAQQTPLAPTPGPIIGG